MKKAALLALILSALGTNAYAVEYLTGRVTILEASYMPDSISVQLDTGNSTCPAGTWLRWSKSADNNKAVYASLLAALVNRSTVNFVINDGDSSCTGQYLHVLN